MNIQNWPMNKIMQLPDECFGNKWVVSCSAEIILATSAFVKARSSLPEFTIIHELFACRHTATAKSFTVEIRLGEKLPANEAEFRDLMPIFNDSVTFDGIISGFSLGGLGALFIRNIKLPISSSGRSLIFYFRTTDTSGTVGSAGVVISSTPKDIPVQFSEEYWQSYMDLVKKIQKTGIGFNP